MTEIRGTTTLVGLLGWPTSHSLSPRMQNAGFAALGLDWAYVPLPTPPELLGDAVRGLVATGFAGANVTIPHKQAVLGLCDELDDVATRGGSVNTLVIREGEVLGSSTDGLAVTSQLEAKGLRALVLGAGGASRAVAALGGAVAVPRAPAPPSPISPRMSSKLGPWPPVRRAMRSAAASRVPVCAAAPAAAPEKNIRKKSEKPAPSPPAVRNS